MRDTYFYCHRILPTVSAIVDLFPVSSGVSPFVMPISKARTPISKVHTKATPKSRVTSRKATTGIKSRGNDLAIMAISVDH